MRLSKIYNLLDCYIKIMLKDVDEDSSNIFDPEIVLDLSGIDKLDLVDLRMIDFNIETVSESGYNMVYRQNDGKYNRVFVIKPNNKGIK